VVGIGGIVVAFTDVDEWVGHVGAVLESPAQHSQLRVDRNASEEQPDDDKEIAVLLF